MVTWRRLWQRLTTRAWPTHDAAWKPTGTRQLFTGYDQQKAREGYEKAQKRSASGRYWRVTRDNVVPIRKVSSE